MAGGRGVLSGREGLRVRPDRRHRGIHAMPRVRAWLGRVHKKGGPFRGSHLECESAGAQTSSVSCALRLATSMVWTDGTASGSLRLRDHRKSPAPNASTPPPTPPAMPAMRA
eukprot:3750302-Rhodomonas_salina.1